MQARKRLLQSAECLKETELKNSRYFIQWTVVCVCGGVHVCVFVFVLYNIMLLQLKVKNVLFETFPWPAYTDLTFDYFILVTSYY